LLVLASVPGRVRLPLSPPWALPGRAGLLNPSLPFFGSKRARPRLATLAVLCLGLSSAWRARRFPFCCSVIHDSCILPFASDTAVHYNESPKVSWFVPECPSENSIPNSAGRWNGRRGRPINPDCARGLRQVKDRHQFGPESRSCLICPADAANVDEAAPRPTGSPPNHAALDERTGVLTRRFRKARRLAFINQSGGLSQHAAQSARLPLLKLDWLTLTTSSRRGPPSRAPDTCLSHAAEGNRERRLLIRRGSLSWKRPPPPLADARHEKDDAAVLAITPA